MLWRTVSSFNKCLVALGTGGDTSLVISYMRTLALSSAKLTWDTRLTIVAHFILHMITHGRAEGTQLNVVFNLPIKFVDAPGGKWKRPSKDSEIEEKT